MKNRTVTISEKRFQELLAAEQANYNNAKTKPSGSGSERLIPDVGPGEKVTFLNPRSEVLRKAGWNVSPLHNWIHEKTVPTNCDPVSNPFTLEEAYGFEKAYKFFEKHL